MRSCLGTSKGGGTISPGRRSHYLCANIITHPTLSTGAIKRGRPSRRLRSSGHSPSCPPSSPNGARVQIPCSLAGPGAIKRGRESFMGGIYIALLSAFSLRAGWIGLPLRVLSQSSTSFSKAAWSILDCARRTRPFYFPKLLVKGVAIAALYCAHRTIDFLLLTRIQRGG